MKIPKLSFIFLLLAITLAACRAASTATPTALPTASPTRLPATFTPQAPMATPALPTPEPPTSTPEILITPTQAVPKTSMFALPEACRVEGSLTYVNRTDSYCFAYPPEFIFAKDAGVTISSGPLDTRAEPLIVSAGILVQPAGDQSLDTAVAAYLQEFVGANPPWEVPNTPISVGSETGRLLDPVPGLGSSRVILAIHNQQVYRLTFYPSPVNPDGSLSVQPGAPAYDKFLALYEAIITSFNFLDGASKTIDVPLKCLESEQPFSFDTTTGECAVMPTPQPTSTPTFQPTSTSTHQPPVTATPDPNQNLGGLRFEDRLDGSSGWLWGYTEEGVVTFSVDNGSVLARLEGKNKGWRVSMGPDSFNAGDQQAQLQVRTQVCGDQDEWGLFFRGALSSDNKFSGYVFRLNCAGQASVVLINNSKSTTLLNWTSVSAAKNGADVENTLLAWAGKNELRFYVNDMYVGTVNDATYTSGEYGLYVNDRTNGNAQFRFYDLRVYDVNLPSP
jgi:hypothetical protein